MRMLQLLLIFLGMSNLNRRDLTLLAVYLTPLRKYTTRVGAFCPQLIRRLSLTCTMRATCFTRSRPPLIYKEVLFFLQEFGSGDKIVGDFIVKRRLIPRGGIPLILRIQIWMGIRMGMKELPLPLIRQMKELLILSRHVLHWPFSHTKPTHRT